MEALQCACGVRVCVCVRVHSCACVYNAPVVSEADQR